MKKIVITFFAIFTLVILPRIGFAATTLSAGDLVIITANATGTYPSTNGFDFVSRVDIDAGTVIYFTDKGWDGSLSTPFWRAGLAEGVVRYTAPSTITAGTIVHFDDSLIAGAPGTWDMFSIDGATGIIGVAGVNVMDFATSGDNLLVFQDPTNTNSAATPSFIYGIGWAGATTWVSSVPPTSNNSWIPSPLSLGTTAISLGSPDNFQYSCTEAGFFSTTFLGSLANSSNWVNNTVPYGTSSCTFDVTQPTVTINQSAGQLDPTNNSALSFTVVFSEAINPSTFIASDIALSGTGTGTVGTPTTSDNITWTVPVTATGNGTIIASLAASTVTDVNGNPNLAATSTDASVTYDTTVPTISEVTPITTPTNDTTPDYTFTTDEAGTITYAGGCSSATTTATAGNNTITLNTLTNGTYAACTITVTDVAGNISNILTLSSFTIDSTTPTVVLSTTAPAVVAGLFTITITPSESISELTLSDISVTNGTASNLIGSGSGPYTVDITPISSGPLTVLIPFGVSPAGVIDSIGNRQDTDSNVITRTVTFVPSAPTVTITPTSATTGTASGTCEAGATVTLASTGLVPNPTTIICTVGGTYTTPITVSANPTTISVTQTNAGGTSSAVIGNFNYVSTATNSGGGTRYCSDSITTFCSPRPVIVAQPVTTPITSSPSLGKPGQCSADLLITQNMRVGARNGRINNYSRITIANKEIMREVKILQTHMNRLGFNSGPVDGILGPLTDGAIKRMQKFLGTFQDGMVGPITRSLINNSCGN